MEKLRFDSFSQFYCFVNTLRTERDNGALAVGIFGSRCRGDHKPNFSDVDVMVVRKEAPEYGLYYWNRPGNINLVATPEIICDSSANGEALRNMRQETRWIWSKKQ